MAIEKNCEHCNKKFSYYPYRPAKYCSRDCYLKGRFGSGKCAVCNKKARIKYCSEKCRKAYWNTHDYHVYKRKYYWEKRIKILNELGGKCVKCGIDDIRVLDINHKDRSKKRRPKDKRKTYTWSFRVKEWKENMKNLEILCANCHRKHTWKQMDYGIKRDVL